MKLSGDGGVEALLERLPPPPGEGPHVVVNVGKGGVGKTTVSILVAKLLAERGRRRVLLVSLDQAMHLLEYLGLPGTQRAYRVSEGLEALQFDLEKEAEKFTGEYSMLLQRIMPGLKALNLERYAEIVRNSPGFEEEVYLRYLSHLYRKQEYDYIVVDTPPTGVTLRILGLPRNYVFWLERLAELRERIVGLRYTMARVLGEKPRVTDPVLDRIRKLRESYQHLHRLITSPQHTTYTIVATPEPLPVYEARKTLTTLNKLGAGVGVIIANKVLPPEKAQSLGISQVQERSLRELSSLDCGPCVKLSITALEYPPHRLRDVDLLVERIRPLQPAGGGP